MKKVLKILGIAGAVVLGIVLIGVAIVAITGGFSGKKKQISSLTVLVNNVEASEAMVNGDFTLQLNYSPTDAQALELNVSVNSYGETVIESFPSKILAGQKYAVQLAKDDNGVLRGGEVKFTFESENKMVRKSLNVMVDVELTDGALEFSSASDGITYDDTDKAFNLTVSPAITNAFGIKSNIAHSINAATGLSEPFVTEELKDLANKKAHFVINDTNRLGGGIVEDAVYKNAQNKNVKYYKVNVQALAASSNVQIKAYVHRLYEIQKAFNDEWFDTIMGMSAGDSFASTPAYNEFINKYLAHFIKTEEAQNFFEKYKTNVEKEVDGETVIVREVVLPANNASVLKESLGYVFVTTNAKVIVADVQIGGFTKAEDVKINVLQQYNTNPTTISDSESDSVLHLVINPITAQATDYNKELLKEKLKEVSIGTYVVYGDGTVPPTDPTQTVSITDKRMKYIEIDDTWYEYNTQFAEVTQSVISQVTNWTISPKYPNYNANTYIGGDIIKKTYLIYSVDNIDSHGTRTTISDKSELKVIYNPNSILFTGTGVNGNQKIVVTTHDGEGYTGYSDYSVNTSKYPLSSTTNIITQSQAADPTIEDLSEYKKTLWFIAYSTNYTADGLQIIDADGTKTYLTNVDGTPFEKDGYTEWQYLGDDESIALTAINGITTMNELGNTSIVGAKLYAMRVVTDFEGNPITITREVDGVDKVTYIVSQCTNSPVNYVSTFMFSNTLDDVVYVYYIDSLHDDAYVEYTPFMPDQVTPNVLNFNKGGFVKLYVSAFKLDADGNIRTSEYTNARIHNLRIALYNYRYKISVNNSLYIDTGSSGALTQFALESIADVQTLQHFEVRWTAQDSTESSFELAFTIQLSNASAVGNEDLELFRENEQHSNVFVKIKIDD